MSDTDNTDYDSANGGGFPILTAVAALILIAAAVLIWLKYGRSAEVPTGLATLESADPEPIAAVNLDQSTDVESAPRAAQGTADAAGDRLFNDGQRVLPFVDGYESEAEAAANSGDPAPATTAHSDETLRLNAFDFGVLDGRVRVGVFGNGPIPRYRTRKDGDRYLIEMTGQFEFSRPIDQTLTIEAYRVAGAELTRTTKGLTLSVSTAPPLNHVPFVIEDSYGLMLAFEPRRPGVAD